ncbi:MAG: DUF4442 domain-containing protein [Nevskiaceae bacterium]|nr:MAG: DUF4442 domain-containing protein [Nevskiaceae bacterium]
MAAPNLLNLAVSRINRLPAPLRRPLISTLFGFAVRFAGTGGVRFERLDELRAILHLRNRRRVRNHIGGIHAAAMALLAESATGAVFGLNLPGGKLPLLKTMHVDYLRRAQGDLRAEAYIDEPQREAMRREARGEALVHVRVTDAAGEEPIRCEMVWAWVPEKKHG